MKYIAKKLKDGNYELTGIIKATSVKGKEVEIIAGKVTINKVSLEETIKLFEEETQFFVEQKVKDFTEERVKQLEELKAELKAIENLGK